VNVTEEVSAEVGLDGPLTSALRAAHEAHARKADRFRDLPFFAWRPHRDVYGISGLCGVAYRVRSYFVAGGGSLRSPGRPA
jgi:hypothetical protein